MPTFCDRNGTITSWPTSVTVRVPDDDEDTVDIDFGDLPEDCERTPIVIDLPAK